MGIDISGGMIVGAHGRDINVPEDYDGDLWEWFEDNGMDVMPQWYDADTDNSYIGFEVDGVAVRDIMGNWLSDVKEKAAKFKELTGVDAQLIGCQDVT